MSKIEFTHYATFEFCFELMQAMMVQSTQSTFTCSKLTIETLEQGVKYVQS